MADQSPKSNFGLCLLPLIGSVHCATLGPRAFGVLYVCILYSVTRDSSRSLVILKYASAIFNL